MLKLLGASTLDALIDETVPEAIRARRALALPAALAEHELLAELERIARENERFRSYLGTGYSDTITPPVILRNVLENPGWYTQYTPYQAEISQGRLEALLNFQTVISDLTGLPIAGASLLDEPTAAAEAMALCHRVNGAAGDVYVRTLTSNTTRLASHVPASTTSMIGPNSVSDRLIVRSTSPSKYLRTSSSAFDMRPVFSPSAIIWMTTGGNAPTARSARDSDSPAMTRCTAFLNSCAR